MGMFFTGNVLNESALENIDVNESIHEAGIQGAYACIAESEVNYTSMMKAFGIMELYMAAKNGGEVLYEAGDAKGFFAKVKEFFVSIWEKVKALYKKFIMTIDSFIKSDADFVRKYRDAILKATTKDFKYKGYKYSIDAVEVAPAKLDAEAKKGHAKLNLDDASAAATAAAGGDVAELAKDAVAVREYVTSKGEELTENMRGAVLGQGKLTAGEFDEELFKKLRSGESEKVEIETVAPHELIDIISNYKKAKKKAEDGMKEIEKKINENIKAVERLERAVSKLVPGVEEKDKTLASARAEVVGYTSACISVERTKLNILQTVNGFILSALKEQYREAKAICVALVAHRPVKESFEEGSSNDFLAGVKFI